jgi:hypothetical protein
MLALTVLCLAAVVFAVLIRIGRSASAMPGTRTGTTVLAIATPIGLAAFAFIGPLQRGWARRAGTPLPNERADTWTFRPRGPLDRPFTATLSGTVAQTSTPGGGIVQLNLRLHGKVKGRMRIRLGGSPVPEGGLAVAGSRLSLTGSQVDLTAPGMPSAMGGSVLSIRESYHGWLGHSFNGDSIVSQVSDASGTVVDLQIHLSIDRESRAVTGTVTGRPTEAKG